MIQPPRRNHPKLALSAMLVLTSITACSSHAALTDLATTPIGTNLIGSVVKPNILL
ncbi:MAG: hypothetical protein ABI612_07365 [Betaproteobacteria bacterium]